MQYHNIIDPYLNVGGDGLWVPTEFDVASVPLAPIDIAMLVELACQQSYPSILSHTFIFWYSVIF